MGTREGSIVLPLAINEFTAWELGQMVTPALSKGTIGGHSTLPSANCTKSLGGS